MTSSISLVASLILICYTVKATDLHTLDLITDCCHGGCGNVSGPLIMNSEGLDKGDNQISSIHIVSDVEPPNDDITSPCLIHIQTLDYVDINISFYLKQGLAPDSILILDSIVVQPKEIIDSATEKKWLWSSTLNASAHNSRVKRNSMMTFDNKYHVNNYRVFPNRIFTIALNYDLLKTHKVTNFSASFVAESGTAGKTFFIILGSVVGFFIFGVPGTFILYQRYRKRKRNRHINHLASTFNAPAYNENDEPRYTPDPCVGSSIQRVPSNVSGYSSTSQQPIVRPRRLSLTERIRKAGGFKVQPQFASEPTSLPKHDLLEKQERRKESNRPVSVVPPMNPRTEWAFPGVDPEHEGSDPPLSIQRPIQSTSSRVISHPTISEEDLYEDVIALDCIRTTGV